MPKKDHLSALIQSLTPAEKKYFVQFTQLRSDDKNYMKLYDAVLKSGEYNAEKLSKQLNKTKANLAHEKEYLIENILKALRNFHDKIKPVELLNGLIDVEVLSRKNLPELSNRSNKKTLAEAKRLNIPEVAWRSGLTQITLDEMTLNREAYFDNAKKHIADAYSNLRWMQTYTELNELMLSTNLSYSNHTYNISKEHTQESNNFLKHTLLKQKFSEPLFQLMQNEMLSGIYKQMKEVDRGIEHARLALELIEEHSDLAQSNTFEYFLRVHSFITPLIGAGKIELYEHWLKKIDSGYYRQLSFATPQLNALFEAYIYGYYSVYYNFMWSKKVANAQHIQEFLTRFEKNKHKLQKQLDPLYWYNLQQSIANLYFHQQLYEPSLEWVNTIINHPEPDGLMTQVQAIARIMSAIIHFHFGNYTLLTNAVQSVKRYLKQHDMFTVVEKTTLDFLLRAAKLSSQKEKRVAFGELYNQYAQMTKDPELLLHLRMFDYRQWAKRNT